MKKLKVDLDEIAFEMEKTDDYGSGVLFDRERGEVVSVPDEVMRAVEEGDEEKIEDLPEWEKELVEAAESILSDDKGRYVEIPKKPSYESYNLMVEFAETIDDRNLREKLEIALNGKGAFRRFKNVLMNYPEEEERWFAFKNSRLRQEVIEWLHSLGIEIEPES